MTDEPCPPVDVVGKLRAALDEEERIARSTLGPDWVYDGDRTVFFNQVRIAEDHHEAYPRNGAHIARHDPARVLRQVAAIRKVLAAYQDESAYLNANLRADGGVAHGLWTAIEAFAEAYGIEP